MKNIYKAFVFFISLLIFITANAGVIKIINKCHSGSPDAVLVSVTGIPDKKKWYELKCVYASPEKKINYNDSANISSRDINHKCNYRLLLNIFGVADIKLKDNKSDNAEVTLVGSDGVSCSAVITYPK